MISLHFSLCCDILAGFSKGSEGSVVRVAGFWTRSKCYR